MALAMCLALQACGGSEDDDSPSVPITGGGGSGGIPGGSVGGGSDTTPKPFNFEAVSDAAPESDIESSIVTIEGINAAADVSIFGGQYSISGATYTSTNGKVTKNQTVRVRVKAAKEPGGSVVAVLNVGGVQANFIVRTLQ
jgi:hypothetical protein